MKRIKSFNKLHYEKVSNTLKSITLRHGLGPKDHPTVLAAKSNHRMQEEWQFCCIPRERHRTSSASPAIARFASTLQTWGLSHINHRTKQSKGLCFSD
eukprot:3967274-Amphidinium_carterae.1